MRAEKDTKQYMYEALMDFTEECRGQYTINNDTVARLYKLCDLVDALHDEFELESINFFLNPGHEYNDIIVETYGMEFYDGCSHDFFKYIDYADKISFSTYNCDKLSLDFGVKNLWIKCE